MSDHDELAGRRRAAQTPDALLAEVVEERAAAAVDLKLAITERERAEAMLAAAYRDDLTGAVTRRAGREWLSGEVDRAHRLRSPLAVIYVDVDGLKAVNDTSGHAAGDHLLTASATALRDSVRAYDIVARFGGDEFVCALPGADISVAESIFSRARVVLSSLYPTASMSAGFAELRRDDSSDELVNRADRDATPAQAIPPLGSSGRRRWRVVAVLNACHSSTSSSVRARR
jgi:diguanylate cyclase (GGDEF)-like protein